MTCAHESTTELSSGLVRCDDCGKVSTGGEFVTIGVPERKPCCAGCRDRLKGVMDEHAKKQGCHGCKKSTT